jgi:hypothetical protein
VNKSLTDPFICQLKDRMFRMIENKLWLVFLFQGLLRNLVCGFDQLTQHRLAANDFRVVFDVSRMRQPVG